MAIQYVEFSKPYMLPGGGQACTGQIIGLDLVFAASLVASGIAVNSGAPSNPSAAATQRVKFVATTMVNGSPPLYDAGDVATFLAPISAQLIAAGLAVSN